MPLIEMDDDDLERLFPNGEAHVSEPTKDTLLVEQKDGYEVREELVTFDWNGDEQVLITKSAYAPDGSCIGTPEFARHVVEERGIAPCRRKPDIDVASIGFCEKDQTWWGWSHRAAASYGIGHIVKENDLTSVKGYQDDDLEIEPEGGLPVGFVAETLEDCKRLASAFASAVA